MKLAIASALVLVLSGCATVPRQALSWTSGTLAVSANRDGCELVNIKVTNNGSTPAKANGKIDILDDKSNNVSTVSFYCESAYPGGTVGCRQSQKDNVDIYKTPGFYCAVYSKYVISVSSY